MSSASGFGDVIAVCPNPASVTAAARCCARRFSSAARCNAIASYRRPRGLPSTSVRLSSRGAPLSATLPVAITSVPASNAVAHGFVVVGGGGGLPPPPPDPPPPLLLPPPPPHAASSNDTTPATRS